MMNRTIEEWQKRVDELRVRGTFLLWELRVTELRYSPDQPRDAKGRFASATCSKGVDFSEKSGIINYAKAFDYTVDGTPKIYHAPPDDVFNELDKSQVGQEAVEYLINNGIKPKFVYDSQKHTNRGMQNGNNIWLYMDNIDSPLIAAQTLVHEVCHHQYGIGQSQWAETVCMAKEKMHKENRAYLTISEKRKLVSLAKKHYGAYQWRRGGQIGGKWV